MLDMLQYAFMQRAFLSGIAKVKEIFGPLIARFIAANASGRRPVYGTAAAFCSLSSDAAGTGPSTSNGAKGAD